MGPLPRRRYLIAAALLAVVVLVGMLLARHSTPPPQYRTARAVLGTVTQAVDVTGTLQPASETDLDFGTQGHVASVNVQAGQRITAGTVLAELDTTSVAAQLDQSRGALASAQAKLNQDVAGPYNSVEATAQGTVNAARGQLDPARINVGDTHELGVEVVQAAQIALQTALAAAQGQISADEQTVAADQRSLFDAQLAGQQAVALAAATLAQVQAQNQATVETAQVAVVGAQRSLADVERVDGAAVQGAQVQLDAAAALVVVDQHAVASDIGQLHADQAHEAADNCAKAPSTTQCQNDRNSVASDQQRLNVDEQNTVRDEGAAAVDRSQVIQAQTKLQADAHSAEQQLATTQVQLRSAQVQLVAAVRQAQVQVAQAQSQSQITIDQAQAQVAAATIQLQNARVAFQSAQETNTNSLAQAQTRSTQSDHQAQAQVTTATIALQNSLAQLSALLNGTIPQQVAMDEAQIQADQSQVNAAQDALASAELVAPVDGLVEQVNVAVGEGIGGAAASAGALGVTAATGGPTAVNNGVANLTHAIVLLTPTAFQVSGPVSDAQLQQIRTGDPVRVVPAGASERSLGRVTAIAPAALVTAGVANYTVTATILGTSPGLHPGASAQMSIVVQQANNVLTVPTSAVHTAGAATYVLVPRGGQEVAQPVTVGASDPVRTQITSGLHVGDTVILADIGPRSAAPSPSPGRS